MARRAKAAAATLIIDGDLESVDQLKWLLGREGFEVLTAQTGHDGIELARTALPDLVLVDWMFPDLSGVEVCRRLRAHRDTYEIPIAMVADGAEEADRARALDSGIDDFISKPYGAREIVARVHALLRRGSRASENVTLNYAGLAMEVSKYKVKRDGTPVALSPLQFKLLRHFLEHPDRVFPREELIEKVWGGADVDPRSVDAQIRRLRSALNKGDKADLFRTVRTGGYALDGGD